MKKIEVDILTHIDLLCTSNSIPYYLAGGTLIGACRHKGFIPWDDDIDIYIPRPYIKQFISLMVEENIYRVFSISTKEDYTRDWVQIIDRRTMLIEKGIDISDYGIFVDVFPVDGLPTNERLRKVYWKLIIVLKNLVGISRSEYKVAEKLVFRIPKLILFPILKKIGPRRFVIILDFFASLFNPYHSKYVANMVAAYNEQETVKRNVIESFIKMEFEGRLFNAPKEYDQYLTNVFGNYMELPPVNDRVSRHQFEAYWR